MAGGTYTLLVALDAPAAPTVGALGEVALDAGWYAYAGSALGPGGFARVERHREVATGEREVRHWHVDHLLGHPDARLADVVRSPERAVECTVARRVAAAVAGRGETNAVAGVGSGDGGSEGGGTAGGDSNVGDAVDGRRVPGFGASDCDCDSHLVFAPDGDALARVVREAHRRV